MKRDVVVIGGSAGGIEALRSLVAGLPPLPSVCFLVVIHVPASARSVLPQILARTGVLPAVHAVDGAPLLRGGILVAPPGHHLVVQGDHVRLTQGPRENSHRPSIDVLFRSAARACGSRVIGVVLSGVLDDGTAGMIAVKMRGGLAMVQSPDDALYPAMPQSVIDHVAVDQTAPAEHLAAAIVARLREDIPEASATASGPAESVARGDEPRSHDPRYTCPDCHGALREERHDELVRYRCRAGHAFSPESLLASQDEAVEYAMWAAFRALEESASLSGRLAQRAHERSLPDLARRHETREEDSRARAQVIRRALEGRAVADPKNPPLSDESKPVE